MKLSQKILFDLYELAKKAALSAGSIVQNYPREDLLVNKKEGGESLASQVVTEVDLLAEKEILSQLNPSLEKYDLALLSEETEDNNSRFIKDYFWCIDPIDGTLPFIEGTPGYSICISLVSKDGVPYIGVIFDPYNDVLYHARLNNGAYKGDQKFELKSSSNNSSFFFINDRSIRKYERYEEVLDKMTKASKELGYNHFESILTGGAAMNSCWMVEKGHGCYFKIPRKKKGGGSIWDFAAAACIVKEAGGFVSDFYGQALDLNRPDSTFMNHKGVIFASSKEIAQKIMSL